MVFSRLVDDKMAGAPLCNALDITVVFTILWSDILKHRGAASLGTLLRAKNTELYLASLTILTA
eukprot:UN02892